MVVFLKAGMEMSIINMILVHLFKIYVWLIMYKFEWYDRPNINGPYRFSKKLAFL